MPNAIMVDKGGYLLFNNVLISDISDVNHYSYTPYQPYVNRGIGYALWPSIALAPGALVSGVKGSKLIRPEASAFLFSVMGWLLCTLCCQVLYYHWIPWYHTTGRRACGHGSSLSAASTFCWGGSCFVQS